MKISTSGFMTLRSVIGFNGPIIFSESNQGPLLGILITGPLGYILGLFDGAIVWLFKTKKSLNFNLFLVPPYFLPVSYKKM